MAAGLGFKDFQTGEVLTAADVDGYLMQGIWVFADATARDAAVTSPQEGNFAFLKDTNVTTYYTGSAWTNLDTTGMVNPMTTTGDTIYSSSGSTPARLGIGTAGQVLQVNSGATAPEWATPAGGGGKVLQVVTATHSTNKTITSTSFTDTDLTATITPTLATSKILVITMIPYIIIRDLAGAGGQFQLLRGATSITLADIALTAATTGGQLASAAVYNNSILDNPATTSATTYKVQGKVFDSSSNSSIRSSYGNQISTIVLLEIGV
jgi:hypothetical protein